MYAPSPSFQHLEEEDMREKEAFSDLSLQTEGLRFKLA